MSAPLGAEETPRKRKQRAILSCNECRRRKLKCDRELPCDRCVGEGVSERCAYGLLDGEGNGKRVRRSSLPHPSLDENRKMKRKDEVPEYRMERLERELAELKTYVRSVDAQNKSEGRLVADGERGGGDEARGIEGGLFKGRGWRTFYYGPTSPMAIVAHFPDLRPFMKQVYVGPAMQKFKEYAREQGEKTKGQQNVHRLLTVPNLRSLLPDRNTVDRLLRTYFDTFETTYRILHAPTFWAAYAAYWDEPFTQNSDTDAIVLSILACTLSTSTHETPRYNTTGSTSAAKAIAWLKACETWMKRQSNKHRTLASVQVRLLRLLALATTYLKTKEYYQEVQVQMAFMTASGMHRDPRVLGSRCSVFEGEMRRRLWATAMEMEIQAAIDKGTPSVLSGLEYDCAAPRNCNDDDLHVDMKCLPENRPDGAFVDSSYLHYSIRSLPLRARLCAKANSLHTPTTFEDTLQDEHAIHQALASLPPWYSPRALLASTLLDLQLRQFLTIIHLPKTLTTHCSTPTRRYATISTLEASETILEKHTKLLDLGVFALCCTRFDYLRAALLICHIAYSSSLSSANTFTTRVARPVFEATRRSALHLLEERSLRPARRNNHFWYLTAAIGLVGSRYGPGDRVVCEREACEMVGAMLYRWRDLEDGEGKGKVAEVVLADPAASAVDSQTPISLLDAHPPAPAPAPTGIPRFPTPDAAMGAVDEQAAGAWMLDDSWFWGDLEENVICGF